MGLKEEVISILKSSPVDGIDFSFPAMGGGRRIEVSKRTFNRVAFEIHSGRIQVTTKPSIIPSGAGGCYRGNNNNKFSNTISLPSDLSTPYSKFAVIHEAVHASFDLTHSQVLHIDNESAAYLASAYYAERTFFIPNGGLVTGSAAVAVILNNNNGYFSENDIQPLRNALMRDPLYCANVWHFHIGDGV